MIKVKKKNKKRTAKKKASKLNVIHKDKEPQFMVQLNDPIAIRRDILECLRDVIIFMQGHEKYLRFQEEKMVMFNKLQLDVKEINSLIENKLRKFLPQGKLQVFLKENDEDDYVEEKPVKKPVIQVLSVQETATVEPVAEPTRPTRTMPSELEEMEMQLRDIEQQLKGIQ